MLKSKVDECLKELRLLQEKLEENKKTMRRLVSTLTSSIGTSAEPYIREQIEQQNGQDQSLRSQIDELQSVVNENELTNQEFENLNRQLSNFSKSIDGYTVDEKRTAIRAVVKRVVWDGKNVHVYVFGKEGIVDFPSFSQKESPKGKLSPEMWPAYPDRK